MANAFDSAGSTARQNAFDSLGGRKTTAATNLQTVEELGYEVPKEKGWSLLGKKFLNVLTGTLNVLRTGEYAIGGILSGKSPITGIREKISPSEVILKDREEERKFFSKRNAASLAIDILLDPITYVTFGTAGVMKLATKGGQVGITKAGRKVMKTMIEKGASDAAARRAMAKLIQEGGEKAAEKYVGKEGLKFMGQVFIPAQRFKQAGKVLGMLPGAGRAGKIGGGVARAFVPFREIDKLPARVGGKGLYTDFLYKPFSRETRFKIFKETDELKKISDEAVKRYGKDVGKKLSYITEKGDFSGDKFLDTVIKAYQRDRDQMLKIEKGTGKKIGEVSNYVRHYLTPEAREFIDKTDNFLAALPKPLRTKLDPSIQRKFLKFTDETGKSIIGTAKTLGLRRLEVARGLSKQMDIGELKSIDDVTKILKEYGFSLEFKAQEAVKRGSAWGYLDPFKKKLVVAAKVPFPRLLETLRHEMAHGGQMHVAGMLDMIETFSKQGRFVKAGKLLDGAKTAAREEWKSILKSIPVDFKTLSSQKQVYYRKPTELLAHAAGVIQRNPELAAKAFPKTVKALSNLEGVPLFKQIKEYGETGIKAEFAYSTKSGKIVDSTPATIEEVNKYMKEKHGVEQFFEENLFKSWAMRKVEHIKFANTHKFLEQTKARFGVRMDKNASRLTDEGIELVESTNPNLQGWLLPKPIVEHVEDTMKFLSNEETTRGLLKAYDKALNIWKVNVTGMFPAFHTRNFIGGFFNNWLAGVKLVDYKDAEKILHGVDDPIIGKIIKEADELPTQPLAKEARKYKSAEEFVKAQGKPLSDIESKFFKDIGIKADYAFSESEKDALTNLIKGKIFHGTNSGDNILKEGFKGGSGWNSGVHFTDSFGTADMYRKMGRGKGTGNNILAVDTKGLKLKDIDTSAMQDIKQGTGGLSSFVKKAKEQGFDGFKDNGGEYLIWNTKKINKNINPIKDLFNEVLSKRPTKSQLTDIYNQATKGVGKVKYLKSKDPKKPKTKKKIAIRTKIGTKYTGQQVLDLAGRFGVKDQPGMMDVARQIDKHVDLITKSKIKRAGLGASNAPRWMMEQVENRLRLPIFINRLKKGYSPAEAAKDSFKFHFDYIPETGLAPFERNVMKRLIPFYTWTRNNIPLQLQQMMKQPGKYAGLEKTRKSLFDATAEEEFKSLPDWMKESLVFPTKLKDDLGRSLWAQLDLPVEDINMLPISSNGIREIASTLTPFLKYPIERFMNRNFYFGGDIWNPEVPREMQTKKTTDALKFLPGPIKKYLNYREVSYRDWSNTEEIVFLKRYEIDAKRLHFLQSFIGRYFSTLKGVSDEDIPLQWRASRYVGGVPVRSVDIESEKDNREFEQENQAEAMLNYLKQHNVVPYASEQKKNKNAFDSAF